MIIDQSIFVGEITIAGTDSEITSANLNAFIAKYEPKFLKMLLGAALYVELVAGLGVQPIEAKWALLRDEVKPMIANYVYYWYIRDKVTQTTQVGNVKGKSENATISSDGLKQVRAWNEMVDGVFAFGMTYDKTPFPSYDPEGRPVWSHFAWLRLPEIYYRISSLNL